MESLSKQWYTAIDNVMPTLHICFPKSSGSLHDFNTGGQEGLCIGLLISEKGHISTIEEIL